MVSIGELFQTACRVCKVDAQVETEAHRLRPERSEVMSLQSDPARAAQLLGWRATLSLEHGLWRIAEWMRHNLSKYDPDVYAI